jgi:hypothetical protein
MLVTGSDNSLITLVMSARGEKFPQMFASARQSRPHRPDRDTESNRALFVRQSGPRAQSQHVLLLRLQLIDDPQHISHLRFVREARH